MVGTLTLGLAAALFAEELRRSSEQLSRRWLDDVTALLVTADGHGASDGNRISIAGLIEAIASSLEAAPARGFTMDAAALETATLIGGVRFEQRATVHQLLREYEVLADLIETFLLELVRAADPPLAADEVLHATRHVTRTIRVLQQATVDRFFARYTAEIERQHVQLLGFGRLVGREMRQPLGVLQVIAGVLPVREGDFALVRLLDVFDRNVRQLAGVAGRLERLSHASVEEAFVPRRQRVDLTALVHEVADKLGSLARARGVRIDVPEVLGVLNTDATRTEMIFLNLIANAIKHSDPAKPERHVEIACLTDLPRPTVIVRDNGVGIPAKRVQHIFRELVRAHPHRDRALAETGLGLGLSIVRDAMDAAGGEVRLESTEGEGTTVTLTWPSSASQN